MDHFLDIELSEFFIQFFRIRMIDLSASGLCESNFIEQFNAQSHQTAATLDISFNSYLQMLENLIPKKNLSITKVILRASWLLKAYPWAHLMDNLPNLAEIDMSDMTMCNEHFETIWVAIVNHYERHRIPLKVNANWNLLDKSKLDPRVFSHPEITISMHFQHLVISILGLPRIALPHRYVDIDSFLKQKCGFAWGQRSPIEDLANEIIGAIPDWMLDEALLQCCSSKSAPRLFLKKFGSSVNGFGSKNSDVDLVLVSDDMEWYESKFSWANSQRQFAQDYLYYLGELLPARWKTEYVGNARVPLLRILDFPISRTKSVHVDITFMNTVCLLNSQLLRAYADQSADTFALCQVVKLWAKSNQLVSSPKNSHSFPTSYAWICLVIFFLQERVGVVEKLIGGPKGMIEPIWGCQHGEYIDRKILEKKPENSQYCILLLWFQFTRFLIEDIGRVVIDLVNPYDVLPRMESRAELVVMDPLEFDRNLTKNVTASSFETIRNCARTAQGLTTFQQFIDVVAPTTIASPRLLD